MAGLRGQIAGFLGCVLLAAGAGAQQPRADGPPQEVKELLPYRSDEVREALGRMFDSGQRSFYEDYSGIIYDLPEKGARDYKGLSDSGKTRFMDLPLVRPQKFYVFYGAYEMMQGRLAAITPLNVVDSGNAALLRYAALPPAARANDLYLWSPDVPYWYSEYTAGGKKLPFRTFFIVHLTPMKDKTLVEVIQDQPRVITGRRMNVDSNGLVHKFAVQNVPPTTQDSRLLLSCIRQFIERRLPARRFFNCRDESQPADAAPSFLQKRPD